jgi:hypothetical protein
VPTPALDCSARDEPLADVLDVDVFIFRPAGRVGFAVIWIVLWSAAASFGAPTYKAVEQFSLAPTAGYTSTSHFDEAPVMAGAAAGYGYGPATGGSYHALRWSSSGSVAIDLNPSTFTASWARATDGTRQVGLGTPASATDQTHALLWSGSAASAIDLNPPGLASSYANGVGDGMEVGSGTGIPTSNQQHALLWTTHAASSAVDLHPDVLGQLGQSFANAVTSAQQVGHGSGQATNFKPNAFLWTGTAASAVDLNPNGYIESYAYGVGDGQQVGKGSASIIFGSAHALLWSGSALSAVDLNPVGFDYSSAYGVKGKRQVGSGYGPATNDQYHALTWAGTAASVTDLHALLPAGFTSSYAYSIDPAGNIFGLALDAGGTHAVEWINLQYFCDFNSDRTVGAPDLKVLAAHWQQKGGYGDGDANADHLIDLNDLAILALQWPAGVPAQPIAIRQQTSLANSTVPEPALVSGLAIILILFPRPRD